MHFEVYGRLIKKIVRTLLRPKTDNILSGLSWVITDDIRAASRVLLCYGGPNLNEDAESLKGVYVTLYANPTLAKQGRDVESIKGDPHLNWQDAFGVIWAPHEQKPCEPC